MQNNCMKRILTLFAAGIIGLCAYAQESRILDDWNRQMEARLDNFFSPFAYTNFTYNNFLGAAEGVNRSGWGIELSGLHFGIRPWSGGRFTLGLFDMAFDFGYLKMGYNYVPLNKDVAVNSTLVPDGSRSTITNFAYMFPIGYIQKIGDTNWSAAILVSPGFGWDRYRNKYTLDNVRHEDDLRIDRGGSYFRMDVKAMIWYDIVGIVARYSFPKDFKGPGVVSAGISFRI